MKLLPTALSRTHTDPYTGVDFNLGFEVSHYTLDLTYRVEPNLLHGEAVLAIRATADLTSLTLDLGGAMVGPSRDREGCTAGGKVPPVFR